MKPGDVGIINLVQCTTAKEKNHVEKNIEEQVKTTRIVLFFSLSVPAMLHRLIAIATD